VININCVAKRKEDIRLTAATLSNVSQFSKFFHRQTHKLIRSKPTSLHICHYTTTESTATLLCGLLTGWNTITAVITLMCNLVIAGVIIHVFLPDNVYVPLLNQAKTY